MNPQDHLPGVKSAFVQTKRLRVHLLSYGDETATPVFFIHGNLSASTYFEELMVAMPGEYRSLAVDLRGYGRTEDKVIDATRGARDWADDLHALFETLGIAAAHLLGWSAGAAAVMQFALDHPTAVKSLTLVAPVSPYGFGGSRDAGGRPCYEDFAGSGGGLVSPLFVEQLQAGDTGTGNPLSPLNLIRNAYVFNPGVLVREQALVRETLRQKIGPQRYPGDSVASRNWPFVAPGRYGPLNAISAKYFNMNALVDIAPKPPVLWLRGDRDTVIDNQSLSDPAIMGQQQLLPGWPGREVYPPQPMLEQMRELLKRYSDRGGDFHEAVMLDVGHSPFIEDRDGFLAIFLSFLRAKGV